MGSEASPSVPVAELQDVIELVIDHRGKTPKKLGGDFTSNGVPVISAIHIKDGRINWSERERYVSEEMYLKWMPVRLRENDILLTSEAPLGEVALVPSDDDLVLSQRLFALRTKPDLMDSAFLKYFLSSAQGQSALWNRATGSTVLGIRQAELMRVMVPVPELGAQQRAGNLLRSLDQLIDANVSNSSIIESIAQTLFRSWFVDFDPVRAKMRGEKPVGMDDATAALFPDSMEESELGDIPTGWSVRSVGEIFDVKGGGTPKTSNPEFWDGDIHWLTPKDLAKRKSTVTLTSSRKISKAGLGNISSGLMPIGTVLLSSRAPIGYLTICEIPTAINQGFIALPANEGFPPLFNFFWLKANLEEILNRAGGTTFPEISKKSFREIPFVVPDAHVVEPYANVASPIEAQLVELHKQTETLTGIRDSLLPRLISGELQLPEDLVA